MIRIANSWCWLEVPIYVWRPIGWLTDCIQWLLRLTVTNASAWMLTQSWKICLSVWEHRTVYCLQGSSCEIRSFSSSKLSVFLDITTIVSQLYLFDYYTCGVRICRISTNGSFSIQIRGRQSADWHYWHYLHYYRHYYWHYYWHYRHRCLPSHPSPLVPSTILVIRVMYFTCVLNTISRMQT